MTVHEWAPGTVVAAPVERCRRVLKATMTETTSGTPPETFEEFRNSFFYGSRSNLDFKFLTELDAPEAAEFFTELLTQLSCTMDDGDAGRLIEHARRWQQRAYGSHAEQKARFRYDDVPHAPLQKKLSDARVALVTSSGHFAEGDDPRPFGVEDMTQAEAEARIGEFLRVEPTLSTIPTGTAPGELRVRHGGYPVAAARLDHNVVLPLRPLRELAADGVIGELSPTAYSFVGATSQLRLRETVAPVWAEALRADQVDAVLLVPV